MAPRRKRKGGRKNAEKDDKGERKIKAEGLIHELDQFVHDYVTDISNETESFCQAIIVSYDLALKNIPPQYHSLTFDEVDSLHKKTPRSSVSPNVGFTSTSAFTTHAFMSKLKSMNIQRTGSANKKKYLTSLTSVVAGKSINSAGGSQLKNSGGPNAHVFSANNSFARNRKKFLRLTPEDQTTTPLYRKACVTPNLKKTFGPSNRKLKSSAIPVTPKFDPKTPLPATLLRKPKAGETIMSMSGSPLQNTAASDNANLEKPAIILTLDNGKVLNLADNNELSNTLELDQKTVDTLLSVQKKLAGILKF